MAKIKKNYFIPKELVEWMESQEGGEYSMTDYVVMGVDIISHVDIKRLQEMAKEMRFPEGMIVDAALYYFSKLNPISRFKIIVEYLSETKAKEDTEVETEQESERTERKLPKVKRPFRKSS